MTSMLLNVEIRPCKTCGLYPTCYEEIRPTGTVAYCKDANGHTSASFDAGVGPGPALFNACQNALILWNVFNYWNPSLLGAALKGWWNADDHGTANMTDDGGGLISTWTDRVSGNAPAGTAAQRPVWGASSWIENGKAALTFTNGTSILTTASVVGLPTGATAGEMWCLFSPATVAGGTHSIAVYGGGASVRNLQMFNANIRIFDGAAILTDLTNRVVNRGLIGMGYWSGTTEGGRVNGTDTNPPTATIGSLNSGANLCRIGASGGGSPVFGGLLRHYLVTTLLSAGQRQQMEGYLAWDGWPRNSPFWPLPPDHPYYNSPP